MANTPTIAITVDVFERRSGVPAALEGLGVAVTMRRLDAGDYVVARSTRIERKTVRGLHADIIDGTFWAQLGRLRKSCNYPFLLLEGRSIDDGPLTPSAIRGAVVTVVDLGVALLRSTDPNDSARWIRHVAARHQKTRPVDRPWFAQRPRRSRNPGEACLAAVPGVSTVRARALLTEFGSVASVCLADETMLQQAHGVGPTIAKAILRELHGGLPHD